MYLPVMLNIKDHVIVIVGGGNVALRRAKTLLSYEGKIRVISTHFKKEFYGLENIERIEQPYEKKYIEDAFIVIAATDDETINSSILKDCKEQRILCNRVDEQVDTDFIFPASFSRGDLILSATTLGNSPGLSKRIIQDLKQQYGIEYEEKVKILGEMRKEIRNTKIESERKKELLEKAIEYNIEELLDVLSKIKDQVNFEQ